MVGKLIVRGIVVGIFAGLLAFGWARAFGEPALNVAIAFEEAQGEAEATADAAEADDAAAGAAQADADGHEHEHTHAHSHEEATGHHSHDGSEGFSRSVQSGIGLLTGIVAIGAGLGGLFAIFFAYAHGRIGTLGTGPTSIVLAVLGLLSFYLVPALKYPASPPAVGSAETIQLRTGLYFLLVAISIATTLAALALRPRLARTYGEWNGTLLAIGGYLLVIGVAFLMLPSISEVPEGFPAAALWDFRLASFGIQTVLWLSLGVMYGYVSGSMLRASGLPA